MLYRWKGKHLKELEGAIDSSSGSSPTEMATEIDRLRKELAKSNRINEILKKRWATLPGKTEQIWIHLRAYRSIRSGRDV